MSATERPRTVEEPMAFTRTEFLHGALAAWLWYLVLALIGYGAILGVYVVVAAIWFVPWSLAMLFVGAPVAYGLGRALRRVRRLWVHTASFAVLGAVVGSVGTLLGRLTMGGDPGMFALDFTWAVNVIASAIAVPAGWWWAVRRARRLETEARLVLAAATDVPD